MTNAENILNDIQLEYLEKVEARIEERKKLLPITDRNSIYALIWNVNSDKWKARLSYKIYCEILDILTSRL